jgi:hypothetical protein
MNFYKFSQLINYHFVLKPIHHETFTITYCAAMCIICRLQKQCC